jgi:hypothetical protein
VVGLTVEPLETHPSLAQSPLLVVGLGQELQPALVEKVLVVVVEHHAGKV